jgi:hypothetical protein
MAINRCGRLFVKMRWLAFFAAVLAWGQTLKISPAVVRQGASFAGA